MSRLDLVSRDARTLELAGSSVDYVLLRKRGRRGVGLKVDETGLTVSAPLSIPLSKVEALVRESERWVLRKIAQWSVRQVPPVLWIEGAALPYLGEPIVLRLAPGRRAHAELSGGELRVAVAAPEPKAIERAVILWYKRAALAHLAQRAFALSRVAGLAPPRVFLSSALSRWGSCNSRREVRLAWRLVKARPELIDYVVCHELAHLRHMNHSRAFWAEVARLCPDYRRLRDELDATDHLFRSF
jgi:predicted metal-dependent hydrolase